MDETVKDAAEEPTRSAVALADLRPGQRLRGVLHGRVVRLVAVDPIDTGMSELFYRDDAGIDGARMVTEADAAVFELVGDADTAPPFDADPDEFRLAAEALRIKYAALYDPMAAVNGSDVDPLPHQIRAVYEEMLPRVPLRFLLADDPGAGKTIMAGLYLKELILRSDCERAIVVAPGGLVEQWHDELSGKFDLDFKVFTRQMCDDAQGRNVFAEHPYLIVRMDQISRDDDLMEQIGEVGWDVAVVDEAHRMSAHYSNWSGDVTETRRFRLGRVLSERAHNLLLMTATPHAGKEEDFQLFMSLLDRDRFEGQFRSGVHRTDTRGLMRRMVKEDLLTFDGKPLFPERHAYTVTYRLSPAEQDLYEQVTDYVRTEMGRAERLIQAGERRRGNNVGFALTVLQRRLASSPEAIVRSLERRRDRLERRLVEVQRGQYPTAASGGVPPVGEAPSWEVPLDLDLPVSFNLDSFDDLDDEVPWLERARFEAQVDEVTDLATAAQTVTELRAEITILDGLIAVARRVRESAEDRKWAQLRTILNDQLLANRAGPPRKLIIFTEHRDTLSYLQRRIAAQLGRADAVVTIHGGTSREDRKAAREEFTHNPDAVVLLATDAAGEGLNLQRAHLMVNYDLPWNPNRIEQRFGRIHRIGQREVCHLWNMVASGTREGEVFTRLLEKIGQMSRAYNGNLFNVLGDSGAFEERSLRELLIEAIRYGDRPEVKAELDRVIDRGVSTGLNEVLQERALHPDMFSTLDLKGVRARMEQARERRLQPGYIAAFFIPAFRRLGGRMSRRESGRYEIGRVPPRLLGLARRANRLDPLPGAYERVTFELERMHPEGLPPAALLAPGHPLLSAVIEATIADLGTCLRRGAVFIDRRDKQADAPALLHTVEQRVTGVDRRTISHHFDYPSLGEDGTFTVTPAPAYLDYDRPRPEEHEAIARLLDADWLRHSHERDARAWAYREGLVPRLEELKARIGAETDRTRVQVRQRLLVEINYWDNQYNQLEAQERQGNIGRLRAQTARERVESLEARLERRMRELDDATHLVPAPAVIRGMALVVPSRMLAGLLADANAVSQTQARFARDTQEVERRAVEAVLAAERALGRTPEEMPHNNPGYDIRSNDPTGAVYYLEVKGRITGADTFTITTNEVAFARTQGDRHRLALVAVDPRGPAYDRVCYVLGAFTHLEPSATTHSYNEVWNDHWSRGGPPC
ncbi:helicase-related protein [Actinomyces glycerinitolerans]|uniref:Uncharacterized protein n=1 Tax=Actinomyces glycerinitolerans TaxID=1892869 RepID=A0A1M4S1S2_9ACTO|nr:helicase-related protein [Actinomyces glycerinitolerans]SHE26184.1 Hypothetical protein ACGLYG10_2427 [Actinomyces glycerinitolerans]